MSNRYALGLFTVGAIAAFFETFFLCADSPLLCNATVPGYRTAYHDGMSFYRLSHEEKHPAENRAVGEENFAAYHLRAQDYCESRYINKAAYSAANSCRNMMCMLGAQTLTY